MLKTHLLRTSTQPAATEATEAAEATEAQGRSDSIASRLKT